MSKRHQNGFVLVSTLMLMALFLSLTAAYYMVTNIETATFRHSRGTTTGFFSAEAALNLRAEDVRQVFVGFNRPTGSSPSSTNPCQGGNNGSGDYACSTYSFNNRTVSSYVMEDPSNPTILTIPPGERYQGLNAQEYRFTAVSAAKSSSNALESQLELRFKSRLVPLFQFAAIFNKDLEILPGANFTLRGPIHTNGNLYLYSTGATLTVQGQVTSAGDIYRGRKDGSVSPNCSNDLVRIYDPVSPRNLIPTCPSRTLVTQSHMNPYNGMIQSRVQALTIPGPEVFDPTPGRIYWDKADLRVVLAMNPNDTPSGIQVRNAADQNVSAHTSKITNCDGITQVVGHKEIFNFRENKMIRILDIDMRKLLECLRATNWFGTNKPLNDSTEGGLVFHFTIKGPSSSAAANKYGVRLKNAQTIRALSGSTHPIGLTVVSDQAVYLQGDFNANNKIPAAVMCDSINILSNAWVDNNSDKAINTSNGTRVATATTINTALLAGSDSTGGVEGASGHGGAYSGGLENFPRFHERWTGVTMTYRGSLVSLGRPRHVNGAWGAQSYNPPNRDWDYDTSFNNAANLPPITPRFVYLRQELFVRDFEQ